MPFDIMLHAYQSVDLPVYAYVYLACWLASILWLQLSAVASSDATAQLDHAGAVRNQQEDVNAAPTPTALNRQHSGGAMPNSRAQVHNALPHTLMLIDVWWQCKIPHGPSVSGVIAKKLIVTACTCCRTCLYMFLYLIVLAPENGSPLR